MYNTFSDFLRDKQTITVIQAENPDGDSLGSALALDYLLRDKTITLYCPVDIPKYLRYYQDWSRITNDFPEQQDAYIIVDTAATVLLSKILDQPEAKAALETTPVLVLDHHETKDDLEFPHTSIIEQLPSCCTLIYKIAREQNLEISQTAAEYLFQGILSDTLGLTTESVTADDFRIAAELTEKGANVADLENRRKEFMKNLLASWTTKPI